MPTPRNRGERADENISFGKRTARQTAVASVFVSALLSATAGLAIELTEPAGAAHGYPGWMDMNGKKLADGEFRQWMQNGRLHIVITYKFPDGKLFEEHARFRQQPELMQDQWSWKEFRGGKPQREFAADFLAGTASAHIRKENETKDVSEKIDIDMGRTFAGFGFAIALGNLRKRLVNGERVELKAVGFTPKPLLRPQVVTVKIWYSGLEQMKMSGRLLRGDNFVIHPEIPAIAKLFIHVPDTHIWLTNPPPAGFLRWEGPIVLPTDPLLRVDLVSGSVSGPAEPVKASNHP
jgi:hypothetical protein